MVARTPREAGTLWASTLQQLVACVTPAVLIHNRPPPGGGRFSLTFPGGRPARLGSGRGLSLAVIHTYAVVPAPGAPGTWGVQTAGYGYELLVASGQSVLAYHWHPTGRSPVRRPHFHLHAHATPLDLRRVHLPSGRVELADVIRFLITELGVRPRRRDWEAAVASAEAILG